MLFARGSQHAARHRIDEVDKAVERAGIQRHPDKDVNGVLDGTAVGIDLGGARDSRLMARSSLL